MIKYVKRLMEPSSHGRRGTSILVRSTGDSIESPDVPPDELPTDPPDGETPEPPAYEKIYLNAREKHQPSVTLIISDWRTIGAWEFSIDGQPYLFNGDETLYDALVSLYEINVAYPHRTDELYLPSDRTTFSLYNNNPFAVSLYFKYIGTLPDSLAELLTVENTGGSTKVRVFDESNTLEVDMAGSKHAYVNQSMLFNINREGTYLRSGNFYILEINGIEYKYSGTLTDLYQYNWDGLEGLLTVYPALDDLVGINDHRDYVDISNKTPTPMNVKIRLDRDMPFTNDIEEVWSKENPKGIYLPTVPELPPDDTDLQYYPYGVIQGYKSVPITVTNEGYSFELAPSSPMPLNMSINHVYGLNSRTRDSLTLTGTVNYPDAVISLIWNDVKYTANVNTVKLNGKYAWSLPMLSYDIFEEHVKQTPDGYINLTVIASRNVEVVEILKPVTYYKPTVFTTPVTSQGYVQRMAGRNIVIDWGDGTVESFSNPTNSESARHTYAVPGSYTITIDRFNNPRGLLWIARNTIGNTVWFMGYGHDNGIKEIVQWESTGYSQIGVGSCTLEKLPNHPPPNTTNLAGILQGSINFNQDLTVWEEITPSNISMAFQGCFVLTSIPPLDTRNCTDFSRVFESCRLLEPDLSSWVTSNGTTMSHMLSDVVNFNSDITGWDVSKVTNFDRLFANHALFNYDINGWNVSSGTTFHGMFLGTQLFNQPLNSWNVSNATTMGEMFYATHAFNQPLNNWVVDSDKTTNLEGMFASSRAFNGDISTWQIRTTVRRMFEQALVFNSPIGQWPVLEKSGYSGGAMFEHAGAFYQDLSSWVVNTPESTVRGTLARYEGKSEWYPKQL